MRNRRRTDFKILVLHDKSKSIGEIMESLDVLKHKSWNSWWVDEIPYHGDLLLTGDGLMWAILEFGVPEWLIKKFPYDGFNQLCALSHVEYAPIKYVRWFNDNYDFYKDFWDTWIENKNPHFSGSDDEYEHMKNMNKQVYVNKDNYAKTENARYFNYVITEDGRFFMKSPDDPYWGSNFYDRFIKMTDENLMCTVVHCENEE